MQTNQKKLHDMVGTAILAAIVVLLQVFVVIPLGAFSITLTLVQAFSNGNIAEVVHIVNGSITVE